MCIRDRFKALRLILDQIPFVDADDQRPALAGGEIGDGEILLLERNGRVAQQHDDFGEFDRAQSVGGGELFELFDNLGAATQAGRIEQLQAPFAPDEIDADGIAGDAGFRTR